jgi:hypothetical protein
MKVASSAHFSLCPVSGGFFLGLHFDLEMEVMFCEMSGWL